MITSNNKHYLHYQIHGQQGPYILMVHGFMSSRLQWQPNVEAMCKIGRPVVIELYGHGRSPSPEEVHHYTPSGYLKEFERIREEIGAESWFVIGQSLGASLTLRYVHDYPERVIAQVFTNSRSSVSDEDFDADMTALAQGVRSEGRSYIDAYPLNPVNAKRMPKDLKDRIVADTQLIDIEGFANTGLHTVTNASVRHLLEEIHRPTLLVVGENERIFLPCRDYAQQIMPNVEVVNLPGGHAVNIDAAQSFNQAVIEFFSRYLPA